MGLSNASKLSDFGSGIGTQGAVLQVDSVNQRVGIGTTNPQATLQVGTGVTVYGNTGIISASQLNVGTAVTVNTSGVNVTGIITATSFRGDGSALTGITAGSTLSAASGTQRVVVTNQTSGTMTSSATDADITFNAGNNTLYVGTANSSFLKADGGGVGLGTTTTTGRNAGVGTAVGTIIYNATTGEVQVYKTFTGWVSIGSTNDPSIGPANPADYPISPTLNQVFTTPWTGSPTNLPTSDANSTWTAPATARRARVIVVGAGGGSPGAYGRGRGAVVDALIDIDPGKAYKVIVGEKGADTSSSGTGGHGCGGGPGVDSNDTGSGSGGSAFFYADPTATSDPAMFPKGVLIAGSGGGGGNSVSHAGAAPGPSPDPIGGFSGISRKGGEGAETGEPGGVGGIGGRVRHNNQSLVGPNAARGSGGSQQNEGYPNCNAGTGGGAGAGGYGGDCNPGASPNTAENAPDGRGRGYDSLNTSGAGRGGDYPMRGGNGFSFNGVNLGGGGGGSHGRAYGSGGWGGGGGSYYDDAGGSGGSGAWGYVTGTASITPLPASGPPAIPINGGTLGGNTPFPSTAGLENTDGAIIIMWDR